MCYVNGDNLDRILISVYPSCGFQGSAVSKVARCNGGGHVDAGGRQCLTLKGYFVEFLFGGWIGTSLILQCRGHGIM